MTPPPSPAEIGLNAPKPTKMSSSYSTIEYEFTVSTDIFQGGNGGDCKGNCFYLKQFQYI